VKWLNGLREIASRFGALLILDEIFTGFGRSGRITFAEDVAADIVCFGKAIGGGFPLSVCVGTNAVMDAWPICESEALHTGTFFGHPLSCRIAAATIRMLKSTKIVEQTNENGEWLRSTLQHELSGEPKVVAIRGAGMMTG